MGRGNTGHRAGPAPDPDALRRDRGELGWTTLLASGREGPPPAWPLTGQTDRERVLWELEWARPQAVVWEHNHQQNEVALYVRSLVVAEQPNATVGSRRLVCQQQHALGVSLSGLLRHHLRIEDGVAGSPSTGHRGPEMTAMARAGEANR